MLGGYGRNGSEDLPAFGTANTQRLYEVHGTFLSSTEPVIIRDHFHEPETMSFLNSLHIVCRGHCLKIRFIVTVADERIISYRFHAPPTLSSGDIPGCCRTPALFPERERTLPNGRK